MQYDRSCQEYQQQINTLHAQFLALGVSTDEAAENLRRLGEVLREKEAQSLIMDKEMEVQSAQLDSLTEKSELLSRSIEEKEQILVDQERIVRERLKTETEQYAATLEAEQQTVVNEFLADWNAMIQETAAKKAVIEQELEQAQKNAWAAVDQAKIALATQQEKDFYRLQLDDAAISDIHHLREVESLLHQPEALNKVIWKVYYEKPYTDLIGRVFGKRTPCGIYKITNIDTQMSYIGQAVNVPERWKQHIKRGCGADTPTQNKLYPAMKKAGPERFMFQLLEECTRDRLDAQEDYWQDFYKVKEFGYSIK